MIWNSGSWKGWVENRINIYGTAAFLQLLLTFPTGSLITTFENAQIFPNVSPLTSVNTSVWRLHLLKPYKLLYFSLLHKINEPSFLRCMRICFGIQITSGILFPCALSNLCWSYIYLETSVVHRLVYDKTQILLCTWTSISYCKGLNILIHDECPTRDIPVCDTRPAVTFVNYKSETKFSHLFWPFSVPLILIF
jgi:hypothetical protein